VGQKFFDARIFLGPEIFWAAAFFVLEFRRFVKTPG
jgi:hypothetical protein